MKSGTCPKCNAPEVFYKESALEAGATSVQVCASFLRRADLTIYVCTQCGYMETYLAQPEYLLLISKKWQKAR